MQGDTAYDYKIPGYSFRSIEAKWQSKWQNQRRQPQEQTAQGRPTYYILNMFPYPSGAGLHVGHYIGYIASDILARYHKHKGYHVMNPMGFDAFGLPAEQYAIQTGQHPAITTAKNIQQFITQLKAIALDFNWERMVNTSDPSYYRWTQWIFLQLFNAWYNKETQKAAPIETLVALFTRNGNSQVDAACDADTPIFSAESWNNFSETAKQAILLHYRLAYLKEGMVNWCEALGTVLANEEVKDGFSERGGHPVTRKKMKQWYLRITAYIDRLLEGLKPLDWPSATKEIQRHWIGRSEGTEIDFRVKNQPHTITVFTTRPETIFGACFLVIAPEHPFAAVITQQTADPAIATYIQQAKNYMERNRLTLSTSLSGVFTGSYALHPFTEAPLPIWIADYVLPHYGSGAVMGVPAHDKRDDNFAKTFGLPTLQIIKPKIPVENGPYEGMLGEMINSEFLNGLSVTEAFENIVQQLIQRQLGKFKIHYKLQDPIFSRQRYWGEPIPIYYKADGLPYALSTDQLPLELPNITNYQPNPSGDPPLSNALNWSTPAGHALELTTMPSWAGASWYFLRYMDPHNSKAFIDPLHEAHWKKVDCYIGGREHATGHLLYARFVTKLLHDLGYIHMDEPFPKLFHQGMLQCHSAWIYRIKNSDTFVSFNLKSGYDVTPIYIPITFVQNGYLNIEALKLWRTEFAHATFILENGQYLCGQKMEKMSKSKHNVINPDSIIEQYGADALRLYLLFLGPLEQTKQWNPTGIEGITRFLNKVWRLIHQAKASWPVVEVEPTVMKTLHTTVKKVTEAITSYSFNTAISSLMICVNTLSTFQHIDQPTIERLILLLAPFAPHIAAELWEDIGHKEVITTVAFPSWQENYIQETHFQYPIAINGKVRTKITLHNHTLSPTLEKEILSDPIIQKWLVGKRTEKVIIVPHRIINIVALP